MEATKDENKVYDEFVKVIRSSHGKGNNSTIYDLLKDYDCTAEDLELVAKKTKNDNYLENVLARYNHSDKAVQRLVNKTMYCNRKKLKDGDYNDLTFGDYGWYFKYIPDEAKQMPILMHGCDVRALFDGQEERFGDRSLSLYCYNYATTLLERDNYPSKLLYDRFKGTKEYNDIVTPYSMKDLTVVYDLSFVWVSELGRYKHSKLNYYMGNYSYNYDVPNGEATNRKDQTLLAEQATQLDILCSVMMTEIYTPEELQSDKDENNENIHNYFQYLTSNYRKTGSRKRNYPRSSRLELFSQAKTLEMLLGMGLGIKCKTTGAWAFKTSNKKLNKRIQTAYKTFIKAKTVDDRKAMRTLLKDQANIIINDFMHGRDSFECVELHCAEEQDKAFEQNASKPIVKTVRSVSRNTSAPVESIKKTFDLAALAKATTKTVEKARNA